MAEIKLPNSTQIEALKTAILGKLKVEITGNDIKSGGEMPLKVTKYPRSPLKIKKIMDSAEYGSPVRVDSIGNDGYVYGHMDNKIFKTVDGFETKEYGTELNTMEAWNPRQSVVCVYKTYAGYVVISANVADEKSEIWFSTEFNGVFAKVADLSNGRSSHLSRAIYNHGESQTVILAGEYGIGNMEGVLQRRLFASFDGGVTFNIVHTLPTAIDKIQNHHYHAVLYDPYDSRIYASVGDGENANIYYSNNLGQEWKVIPRDKVSIKDSFQQPTLLMALSDRIATGPDKQTAPSVISFYKDREFMLPYTEQFNYKFDYAIMSDVPSTATLSYSTQPYAQDGNEVYFTVPAGPNNPTIVVATGDGGNTWHKVFSLNLTRTPSSSSKEGIVGIDKNGFMYLYAHYNGPKTFVLDKANWI